MGKCFIVCLLFLTTSVLALKVEVSCADFIATHYSNFPEPFSPVLLSGLSAQKAQNQLEVLGIYFTINPDLDRSGAGFSIRSSSFNHPDVLASFPSAGLVTSQPANENGPRFNAPDPTWVEAMIDFPTRAEPNEPHSEGNEPGPSVFVSPDSPAFDVTMVFPEMDPVTGQLIEPEFPPPVLDRSLFSGQRRSSRQSTAPNGYDGSFIPSPETQDKPRADNVPVQPKRVSIMDIAESRRQSEALQHELWNRLIRLLGFTSDAELTSFEMTKLVRLRDSFLKLNPSNADTQYFFNELSRLHSQNYVVLKIITELALIFNLDIGDRTNSG